MIEREVKAEVWLPLTQGKVTVIDFDDFEKVRPYKWYAMRSKRGWYACRDIHAKGIKRTILLHRDIFGEESISPGFEVAHLDGDGLNCRGKNLKGCTHAQNMQGRQVKSLGTSSQYRGVYWDRLNQKWVAHIKMNGKKKYLGRFIQEEDAARAYDAAARQYFGAHAAPNFSGE